MDSFSGAIIDQRYRISRLLGEGGMGAVYEAVELRTGRLVALKVLHGTLADPAARERFEREARALSELRHPSLVRVLDYSARGAYSYFVMELAPGVHLGALAAQDGPLAPERAAKIALAVLGALDVAHARGIIHRDVKPQNIQVSPFSGGGDAVRLLDFGLAKDVSPNSQRALTEAGVVVGTMQYMAPEQAQGMPLDARVDIYAVGACLYTTLSGRRPYEGLTGLALYRAVLADVPARLADVRPELPRELVAIIERAMSKDPRGRYASAREMARALSGYLASAFAASPLARSLPVSTRSPHWGRTVPLAAIPFRSQPPASGAPTSSEAAPTPRAADTPVPNTTPCEPPPDACPPTQRSGKGTMLAGLFVLFGLLLTVGVGALAVRANAPAKLYAAIPR